MFEFPHKYLAFYTLRFKKAGERESFNETYIMNPDWISESPADRFGKFAIFSAELLIDIDKAEKFFLKALQKDPKNHFWLGNYAVFLHYYKKDILKAKRFYELSLLFSKKDTFLLLNYAFLNVNQLQNFDKAENLFKQAIDDKYENPNAYGSYALFLYKIRNNYSEALKNIKIALKNDPVNPYWLLLYAALLLIFGKNVEAERVINHLFGQRLRDKSILIDLWFLRYCFFSQWLDTAKREIYSLIEQKITTNFLDYETLRDLAIKRGHPDPKELQEITKYIIKSFEREESEHENKE